MNIMDYLTTELGCAPSYGAVGSGTGVVTDMLGGVPERGDGRRGGWSEFVTGSLVASGPTVDA